MQEHDHFVVDTRRGSGNRRALPQRPARPDSDRAQGIPVRRSSDERPARPSERGRADRGYAAGDSTRAMPRPTSGQRPRDERDSTRVMPTASAAAGTGAAGVGASRQQPVRERGPLGADTYGDGDGGRGSAPYPREEKRPRRRRRKWVAGVLVLLLLWIAAIGWAGMSAWNKVAKVDAMPAQHLAGEGQGTNILLVGSDGRGGLTDAQRRRLGTGTAEGQRTDSIMILHIGGPKPTLMSIPRDSYVTIPGHTRKNKINASFSMGGPKLLIQTVEQNTGIHIDNYMEIGFGGFAGVVDSVGGVDICVKRDMNDPKAHINLKAGCQTLDGPTALGYVRARYSDPEGDIGRAKRQRQFLGALMKKISSPTNLILPWRLKGAGESGAQGLAVDKDMSMTTALRTMLTLKKLSGDGGNSVVVPIGNTALPTWAGEAVEWDAQKSQELFKAIRENGDTSAFVKKTGATN